MLGDRLLRGGGGGGERVKDRLGEREDRIGV